MLSKPGSATLLTLANGYNTGRFLARHLSSYRQTQIIVSSYITCTLVSFGVPQALDATDLGSGPICTDSHFPTSRGVHPGRNYLYSLACRWAPFYLYPSLPLLSPPPLPSAVTMHEVSRLLQAAAALSQLLRDAGVPHAFYGSVLTAVLSKAPLADVCYLDVYLIVGLTYA